MPPSAPESPDRIFDGGPQIYRSVAAVCQRNGASSVRSPRRSMAARIRHEVDPVPQRRQRVAPLWALDPEGRKGSVRT